MTAHLPTATQVVAVLEQTGRSFLARRSDIRTLLLHVVDRHGGAAGRAIGAIPLGDADGRATPFRVASNAKTYTAAAVWRLIEDGQVEPGDSIAAHLDDCWLAELLRFHVPVKELTIERLLTHRSCLPDWGTHGDYLREMDVNPSRQWRKGEQIEWILTRTRLRPVTGLTVYSDTAYNLLALLLERWSSENQWGRAVRTLLEIERHNLVSTWWEAEEPLPPRLGPMLPLFVGERDQSQVDVSFDALGGGGICSTAEDLAFFYSLLLDGQLFEHPHTLTRMLISHPGPEPGVETASGLFRCELFGRMWWYHLGYWGSFALACPALGTVVAGIGNQATAAAQWQSDLLTRMAWAIETHVRKRRGWC